MKHDVRRNRVADRLWRVFRCLGYIQVFYILFNSKTLLLCQMDRAWLWRDDRIIDLLSSQEFLRLEGYPEREPNGDQDNFPILPNSHS